MLAPPELKEIHPLGKAPIMKIESEAMPEDKPLILAESANMVEYVVEHFGQHLAPKKWREGKEGQVGGETEEWMRYRYYLHYAEGSLMPPLLIALLFNGRSSRSRIRNLLIRISALETRSPFFIKPLTGMMVGAVKKNFLNPTSETNFAFLESQIASSPNDGKYLCGETLTAADIMMSFPLGAAKGRSTFSKEKHPKLWEYVERLENLDAYKTAVQKIVEVEGSYDGSL